MRGKNTTTYVKKYDMTSEELKLLKPLHDKRHGLAVRFQSGTEKDKEQDLAKEYNDISRQISYIVSDIITKRIVPPSNVRYQTRFSIDGGWIKLKQIVNYADLTKSNYQDVIGWGK